MPIGARVNRDEKIAEVDFRAADNLLDAADLDAHLLERHFTSAFSLWIPVLGTSREPNNGRGKRKNG